MRLETDGELRVRLRALTPDELDARIAALLDGTARPVLRDDEPTADDVPDAWAKRRPRTG